MTSRDTVGLNLQPVIRYMERLGFRVLIPPLRRFENGLTVCLVGRSYLHRRAQGPQHFPELRASRRCGQGATDVQRRLERKQAEVFGLRLQLQPNYLGLQIDEPASIMASATWPTAHMQGVWA